MLYRAGMPDPRFHPPPARFAGQSLACARGFRLVFTDLSFALEPGGAIVLTGPNGSGKSSLLRLMAGLLPPHAGQMWWAQEPVADDPVQQRLRVAYLGHLDACKPVLTALENVAFWAALARPHGADGAAAALEAMGLGGLGDVPGRFLSAGQKRRLALARLLVAPTPLWLLDEPAVALDDDGRERLEHAIAGHRAAGGMVALATHSPIGLAGASSLELERFRPGDAEVL